jgi:ABC-type amino acid transport substrate-binding protein
MNMKLSRVQKNHFVRHLTFCLIFLLPPLTHAKEVIKVGLAHFPPFIETHGNKVSGLASQMLELINQHQNKYLFQAIPTLPATRHETFRLGRYDMSMFDNLAWGWKGLEVDASDSYLQGGEVYIARSKKGRDQSYFDDLRNRKLIGIQGYHYQFADFNADEAFLKKTFHMQLTKSNLGSIKMLLSKNRGDIAVVSISFLAQYLRDNPGDKKKLLVSKKKDQAYQHSIILRRGIKPTIAEINSILAELKANGKLQKLWKAINPSSVYP